MERREFITLLGSAAAIWPLAARAQPERVRHIGVLVPVATDDPEIRLRLTTFQQAVQGLGWTDGRNVHIETRFSAGNAADTRKYAAELAALVPDVILAVGSAGLAPMLQATQTVPIVFVIVPDPVGSGFVHSLSRPGGNTTGLMMFEYNLCGKWLELLKEIAPGVTRAAVLRDPALVVGIGQFDAAEIKREVAAFAQSANGGLIATASALTAVNRDLIIALAAQHKLPAVYQERNYVTAGGLISCGPDFVDQFRRAAGYVDRILKGEKPADLPVQAPTKYELAINLKTAKALGLAVPPSVRARADEVLE